MKHFLSALALGCLLLSCNRDLETHETPAPAPQEEKLVLLKELGGEATAYFSYKNRNRQLLLNTFSIAINAVLIALLVYWLQTLSGGISFPEKGIEPAFPSIAVICLFLANIYIRKDERLVKSVDRLR